MFQILKQTVIVTGFLVFATTNVKAIELSTRDGNVNVLTWGYQLQGPSNDAGELLPESFATSDHDLLVVDFARFGDEPTRFTPAEVQQMQQSPRGRRVLAAYLSIGEASEFRSFWSETWTQSGRAMSPLTAAAPDWLGPTNEAWPESRKVRYWDDDVNSGWQRELFNPQATGWLDQIVEQGFDAVYLDIVDAYYYWAEDFSPTASDPAQAGDPQSLQDSAARMIDLVVAMTNHARETNPNFFAIPQNGGWILNDLGDDEARKSAYLDAIGAIAIEDAFNGGDLSENNPSAPDEDRIATLRRDFLAKGKPVLSVEYLDRPNLIGTYEQSALDRGFIPYSASSRQLDTLNSASDTSLGDFSKNGALDVQDLDLLHAAVRSGRGSRFDIDDSGRINEADVTLWIGRLFDSHVGDANLDREFNSTDLIQVFSAGQYEDNVTGNSTWSTGDWNGDGEFDSLDIVFAFQDGGYDQGAAAVPEPSSALLIAIAIWLPTLLRRD